MVHIELLYARTFVHKKVFTARLTIPRTSTTYSIRIHVCFIFPVFLFQIANPSEMPPNHIHLCFLFIVRAFADFFKTPHSLKKTPLSKHTSFNLRPKKSSHSNECHFFQFSARIKNYNHLPAASHHVNPEHRPYNDSSFSPRSQTSRPKFFNTRKSTRSAGKQSYGQSCTHTHTNTQTVRSLGLVRL